MYQKVPLETVLFMIIPAVATYIAAIYYYVKYKNE